MNDSLRKKHAARIAAVQILYERAMLNHKAKADKLINDYLRESADDAEWNENSPDKSWLKKLIHGTLDNAERIEPKLEAMIGEEWSKERLSPVILALLRCAIYEITYQTALKPAIIIDEYVTIAHAFVDEKDSAFVNGALHKLSADG
jgi:N utilization substance protein B